MNGKELAGKMEEEILYHLPPLEGARELVRQALARGQEHLFEGWEARSPQFRETLLRELARIDWEVLDQALELLKQGEGGDIDPGRVRPKLMRTWQEQQPDRPQEEELGREALIEGRVGWLIPAGGSGSRLVRMLEQIYDSLPFQRRYRVADQEMRQFDAHSAKGQLPITPVLGKSLYGLFMEQALALGARVQRMPVLIFMLSDETREASLHAITRHPLFPAIEQALVLFDHGMNPVLDDLGRIILKDDQGQLVFSGNGNGGMFKAMQASAFRGSPSIFGHLERLGVELIGFSNVDNPVADIILPRMLGSHLRFGKKLTFGVVKKADAQERVGMIVRIEGQAALDKIEYNEFPERLAVERNPEDPSRLHYEHGDVNVFLMDLAEMAAVRKLPLRMYRGKTVRTQWGPRLGQKFESFAFHIIRQVMESAVDVKEIRREDQFMPTKNSVGRDSPATVIRALCTRAMRWLEAQGARVAHQDEAGCRRDLLALIEGRVLPVAAGSAFAEQAAGLRKQARSALEQASAEGIATLFEELKALAAAAQIEGATALQVACDCAWGVLRPGEAKAFVEFSPCFALEAEDLAESGAGNGWVLEEGCQLALTGHPSQVLLGEGLTMGRDSVLILDIKREYGGIVMNEDRWLTFELEAAGKAEIGDNVTLEAGAELEVHIHGAGRLVIPAGTVVRGQRFIEVRDGETLVLEG